MIKKCIFTIGAALLLVSPSLADDFTLSFEWGDIPLCTTGSPNKVPNPRFLLANVPEKTKIIVFKLNDLDAPNYDHGGGKISYTGNDVIEPGAFKYMSPCPPGGSHRYVWKATAKESDGFFSGSLGTAKAMKQYP